jgi:hypothetical protein
MDDEANLIWFGFVNPSQSALSTCRTALTNWIVFEFSGDGSNDAIYTFGARSPIFLWIVSELVPFSNKVAQGGTGTAEVGLFVPSFNECTTLMQQGWPVDAMPAPPASSSDPAPVFYGVQSPTTTTILATPATASTTSCGSPRLQRLPDGSWPNSAPSAAIEAVKTFMKHQPGPPITPLTITGALDPCNSAWVKYDVYNPVDGGASGYEHLVGSAWKIVVPPGNDDGPPGSAGQNGYGIVPAQVLGDFS